MQGKARFSSGWFFTNSQNRLSLCHDHPSRQISSLSLNMQQYEYATNFSKERISAEFVSLWVSVFKFKSWKKNSCFVVSVFRGLVMSWWKYCDQTLLMPSPDVIISCCFEAHKTLQWTFYFYLIILSIVTCGLVVQRGVQKKILVLDWTHELWLIK